MTFVEFVLSYEGGSASLRGKVSRKQSMNQGELVFAPVMERLQLTTFRRRAKLGSSANQMSSTTSSGGPES